MGAPRRYRILQKQRSQNIVLRRPWDVLWHERPFFLPEGWPHQTSCGNIEIGGAGLQGVVTITYSLCLAYFRSQYLPSRFLTKSEATRPQLVEHARSAEWGNREWSHDMKHWLTTCWMFYKIPLLRMQLDVTKCVHRDPAKFLGGSNVFRSLLAGRLYTSSFLCPRWFEKPWDCHEFCCSNTTHSLIETGKIFEIPLRNCPCCREISCSFCYLVITYVCRLKFKTKARPSVPTSPERSWPSPRYATKAWHPGDLTAPVPPKASFGGLIDPYK